MRHAPLALVAALGLAVAGCLDASVPPGVGGNGATADSTDAGAAAPDLAPSVDLAPPTAPRDMASTDLAGFTNCFGVTVCDPTTQFCIRLIPGSAGAPGWPQTPACYEPVDCMGANMNCDCITQDPVLSLYCANCVDHMDGTYDCYSMQ